MIVNAFDWMRPDLAPTGYRIGMGYVAKSDLRANPLTPPPGYPFSEWADSLSYIFCQAYKLFEASGVILARAIKRSYQKCRERGALPTWFDALHELEDMDLRGEQRKYRERLVPKIWHLLTSYGRQFNVQTGITPSTFIERGESVIWQIPDEMPTRAFLLSWHLYFVLLYANANPLPQPVALILDEVAEVFPARAQDGGVGIGARIVTLVRGVNIVLIVASQNPSALDRFVTNNLGTVVMFRNQGLEVRASQIVGGLTQEQADELRSFTVGRCAVCVGWGDRLHGPVLVDVPKVESSDVTPEALAVLSRQTVEPLLSLVRAAKQETAPPPPRDERDPSGLSKLLLRVLRAIHCKPRSLEMRCAEESLTKAQEGRCRRQLKELGLVQLAGTFGNKFQVWTTTPKAEPIAKRNNWRREEFKSGAVHQAALIEIKISIVNALKAEIRRVDTVGHAASAGGMEPDLTVLYANGDRTFIQIAASNNTGREGDVLIKLSRLDLGTGFVMAIALDTNKEKALRNYVLNECQGTMPDRLAIHYVGETFATDWSWRRVLLERPC